MTPSFKKVKIIVSLYDDAFPGTLNENFKAKIAGEGVPLKKLELLSNPTYQNLMQYVLSYADGVILETAAPDAQLMEYLSHSGKPVLPYQPDKSSSAYLDSYQAFYNKIQAHE